MNLSTLPCRASLQFLFVAIVFIAFARPTFAQDAPVDPDVPFPEPAQSYNPDLLGRGLERSLALLSQGADLDGPPVRILFYGQSITEQDWWRGVAEDIRQVFPDTPVQIENRALAGFSSQRLVKTAKTDLYPFYPDLVIFHVYGAHNDYEEIIRQTRKQTTADILIQTDHITADDQLDEIDDPELLRVPDGKIWNSFMNYGHIPAVAARYGCGIVDQRNLWKAYLREHNLPATKLLRDSVHLNEHGCFVMRRLVSAAILMPAMNANSTTASSFDPMNNGEVRTLLAEKDFLRSSDVIEVPFDGNRVDVKLKSVDQGAKMPIEVKIDGSLPGLLHGAMVFTRGTTQPGGKWPAISDIGSHSPLVEERWTLTATLLSVTEPAGSPSNQPNKPAAGTKKTSDSPVWSFKLAGSQTGDDGEGRSDVPFISRSGRVVIDPSDWDVSYAMSLAQQPDTPKQFVFEWDSKSQCKHSLEKNQSGWVTIAQGIDDQSHTLKLSGGIDRIEAIRVYSPKLRKSIVSH